MLIQMDARLYTACCSFTQSHHSRPAVNEQRQLHSRRCCPALARQRALHSAMMASCLPLVCTMLCTYMNGQALYPKPSSGELHLHTIVSVGCALTERLTLLSWHLTEPTAPFRRRKDGLTDAVRDIDFSRAHANNAVRLCMHRTRRVPPGTVSPAASFEVHFVQLVVQLTSGHINIVLQVIAVTCEDGSCSLWSWSGATHVGDLELPSGVSCPVLQHGGTTHLPTIALTDSTAKCIAATKAI